MNKTVDLSKIKFDEWCITDNDNRMVVYYTMPKEYVYLFCPDYPQYDNMIGAELALTFERSDKPCYSMTEMAISVTVCEDGWDTDIDWHEIDVSTDVLKHLMAEVLRVYDFKCL